ncbi:hypothetical protein QUF75_19940 [Desulfococcaceae bacterium HSG7]|nr:hypothetical protein [Desulfococcaceae bacterium HSG7]
MKLHKNSFGSYFGEITKTKLSLLGLASSIVLIILACSSSSQPKTSAITAEATNNAPFTKE